MRIPTTAQSMNDSLTAYLRRLPAGVRVNLAVQSLADSSESFVQGATDQVPSASVIKLPIMIEAMEQVKAGRLDLDEIHILTDGEKVGGDGVLKTYSHRSRVAYRDLLRLMMIYSDNTATIIFINELGMDAINRRIQALGLSGSQLNRVMMDTLAVRQGRENYVTARDMNRLLGKLYRNEVATPELCAHMIAILKQNEDMATIPKRLPAGTVVAHKTGTLAYIRGDAAIVYAREPFLLSIFVAGVPTPQAEQLIADISLICYTHFARP